jgi:hypothetical protein
MPKSQLKHHSQPRHTTDLQVPFPLTPSYHRGVYPVIHALQPRTTITQHAILHLDVRSPSLFPM